MMKKLLSFLLILLSADLFAQETHPPFWEDIQRFRQQDSLHAPPAHAILFVGSSSFTKWTDVQNYFPGYPIINRGFGGSTLQDVIRYADDVIFKYHPRQIVIYCGENDFANNDSLYPAQVAERFFHLFRLIRSQYKKTPVAYISMKPSPSRRQLMKKFDVANVMIREYLRKRKNTAYIDVYHSMLDQSGAPLNDIFTDDNLHMNAKGYAIWQKIIQPYLIK